MALQAGRRRMARGHDAPAVPLDDAVAFARGGQGSRQRNRKAESVDKRAIAGERRLLRKSDFLKPGARLWCRMRCIKTHPLYYLTKSDVAQRSSIRANMDGARKVAKHRHTAPEIAKKLAMADEMTAQGRLQGDIVKSLGISVMTYHRWRKARGALARAAARPVAEPGRADIPPERGQTNQIRELQLENSRLRRLVTDLLLEKVKLEEGLRSGPVVRRTLAHG
jgi:putative transposase